MPKQILEIRTFNKGIMANPQDELDIPNDAATYSLNIDPLKNGELSGIPDCQYLKQSGFKSEFSIVSYTKPENFGYDPSDPTTARQNLPSGN
jgi:hypothetical protein|tara:strand:+ start:428 stop:703 length:276 start_codon:yes stop_codon:yes gene_type:complete